MFSNDNKQSLGTNNSKGCSLPPKICVLSWVTLRGALQRNLHTRYKKFDQGKRKAFDKKHCVQGDFNVKKEEQ